MLIEERLKEIQENIKKKVPKGITVTSVEFEVNVWETVEDVPKWVTEN